MNISGISHLRNTGDDGDGNLELDVAAEIPITTIGLLAGHLRNGSGAIRRDGSGAFANRTAHKTISIGNIMRIPQSRKTYPASQWIEKLISLKPLLYEYVAVGLLVRMGLQVYSTPSATLIWLQRMVSSSPGSWTEKPTLVGLTLSSRYSPYSLTIQGFISKVPAEQGTVGLVAWRVTGEAAALEAARVIIRAMSCIVACLVVWQESVVKWR